MRHITLIICILCLSMTISGWSQRGEDRSTFLKVTDKHPAMDAGETRGIAWADFDRDGDDDLFIANAGDQMNILYENLGDGTFRKKTDFATGLGEPDRGQSQGVNWVDYDNDGDLDLYVVNRGDQRHSLYRNDGNDLEAVRVAGLTDPDRSASMAAWADVDLDGDLDVALAGYNTNGNTIIENMGNGQFVRRDNTGIREGSGRARALSWGDLNGDFLPDLFVANARQINELYLNLGDWEFEAVTNDHLQSHAGYSYGSSWFDIDQDGDLDLFVANFDSENAVYFNGGDGQLEWDGDHVLGESIGGASKGHTWGDFNLDGFPDLFVANGTYGPDMQNFLFWGTGGGGFLRDTNDPITQDPDTSAGAGWADIDIDGDLDIFVANWGAGNEENTFYLNMTNRKSFVKVHLEGRVSNSHGIGSKVELKLDNGKSLWRWMWPVTGYGSQNAHFVHFGIPDGVSPESINIHWSSGTVDQLDAVEMGVSYLGIEGQGIRVSSQ